MIKGIGHTAYTVADMEKSLDFYCGILGFEKLFDLHNDNDEPWIIYLKVTDGQYVELFYGGEKEIQLDKNTIGYSHFCLEVEDIHEIATYLKSKGCTLDVEPKQGKDGNFQCWTKDPDGNRIEFIEMRPGALQLKKS